MAALTRVSSAYTTVIPAALRRELGLAPGDQLEWELRDDVLRVRRRKQVRLEDLVGLISHGGNAVEDGDRMYDEMW